MVELWGRHWTRPEVLARVGRLDQLAGVQLTEAADERGELEFLAAGEQRHYELEIGALSSAAEIEEFAASARDLADASAAGAPA